MIIGENVHHQKIAAELPAADLKRIKDFISGTVYCWCLNKTETGGQSCWFTAANLFGGLSADWSGTPLQTLVDWHNNAGASNYKLRAVKDLRFILMRVIADDLHRSYRTGHNEKGRRSYQWTGIGSRRTVA